MIKFLRQAGVTRLLLRWLQPFLKMRPATRRLSLALFLWGMGEGLWLYMRPLYVTHLGGNAAQVGQLLGVIGLAPVLVMVPVGWLSDRIGPYRLMVYGWGIGTLAVGAMALAPDWRWLFPAFFTYAISAAAIPAMNAYVALDIGASAHDQASTRQIQLAVSTSFAAYMGGAIVSPVIGGWIAAQFGLRSVLWISIAWLLVSTLIVMSLPQLAPLNPRPIRMRDFAKALSPSLPRMTRDQRRIYGVLLVVFLVMALGNAMVPSYLEDIRDMPIGVIGALGTATALGGTVWLLVLGRLSSRAGLVFATLLMMAAMVGLVLGPTGILEFPSMAGVYFMLGAFMTVRTVSLSVVSEYTPPEQRGMSFGIVEMVLGLGMFIGPWLAGILYSGSPSRPFLLAAAVLAPLLIVVWFVLRGRSAVADEVALAES